MSSEDLSWSSTQTGATLRPVALSDDDARRALAEKTPGFVRLLSIVVMLVSTSTAATMVGVEMVSVDDAGWLPSRAAAHAVAIDRQALATKGGSVLTRAVPDDPAAPPPHAKKHRRR